MAVVYEKMIDEILFRGEMGAADSALGMRH